MSASAPQGSQGPAQPQQQQGVQLLKADDLLKLQCLNEDMKQKYRPVLQNFWAMLQQKPQGSPEYQQARQKLQEWSSKLIAQERQFRARNKPQPQQAGNAQQPQLSQPPKDQQPSQTPQTQPQPTAQPPAQPPQQANRPPQQQQPQINPEIIKHVQQFQYYLPPQGPHPGTPEGESKLKDLRNSYLLALNKQEKSTHKVKAIHNMIEQRKSQNQDVSELLAQKTSAEADYNSAKRYVEEFRRKQMQWKSEREGTAQRAPQGQATAQQAQPPQVPNQGAQTQTQQPQSAVKQEPQVKMEPQPSQQPQFTGMQGGPQPPQQGMQVPTPTLPQQSRQPPPSHPQQMQQPNQPASFAPQQQTQQPQRPQINPQQANTHQQHQVNSPLPGSATSNPAGPPVPLSHQAAVNIAQRSYSNQEPPRTGTPMQPGQGSFQTPGTRERDQLNNPKLPIPRTLNVTQPVPVSMGGGGRPTMSGPTNGAPGPMGQPVITKFPQFQLEGEGDRVLSKRKLDELVRQVTGGSEDALTQEVEEVWPKETLRRVFVI